MQVVEAGTSRLNWRSAGINEFIAEAMEKVRIYVCMCVCVLAPQ